MTLFHSQQGLSFVFKFHWKFKRLSGILVSNPLFLRRVTFESDRLTSTLDGCPNFHELYSSENQQKNILNQLYSKRTRAREFYVSVERKKTNMIIFVVVFFPVVALVSDVFTSQRKRCNV